ncbi:MAG: hypothetical protein ACE5F5_02005 [Acidimicrobiia bacterium]
MSDRICDLVTRRQFVTGLGSAMLLVACSGRTVSLLQPDPTSTLVDPTAALPIGSVGPNTDRVLVVIEMGGGNDGLNTVVPHATDAYFDLRKNIRVTDPIDLDGEIGLHPSLEFVAAEFQAGRVALVEGWAFPIRTCLISSPWPPGGRPTQTPLTGPAGWDAIWTAQSATPRPWRVSPSDPAPPGPYWAMLPMPWPSRTRPASTPTSQPGWMTGRS